MRKLEFNKPIDPDQLGDELAATGAVETFKGFFAAIADDWSSVTLQISDEKDIPPLSEEDDITSDRRRQEHEAFVKDAKAQAIQLEATIRAVVDRHVAKRRRRVIPIGTLKAAQLQDELLAAGIAVEALESTDKEIRIRYPAPVQWSRLQAVIDKHVARPDPIPVDRDALKTKIRAAKNFADIKDDLVALLD
jgi:hypothetical protein